MSLSSPIAARHHDIITDFSAADDALRLDKAAYGGLGYTGQLRAGHFVQGTATADILIF